MKSPPLSGGQVRRPRHEVPSRRMELPGQGLSHPAGGAAGGVAPVKWKCTYSPEETEDAGADLAVLLQRHPGAKVRRDKSKAPQMGVYVTISKSQTVAAVRKTLDPSPCDVV